MLPDDAWRALYLAVPDHLIGREIASARDPDGGGHLTVVQLCELVATFHHACQPIGADELNHAREEFTRALSRIDLDALAAEGRPVSLFLWEDERDGPRPATDHVIHD